MKFKETLKMRTPIALKDVVKEQVMKHTIDFFYEFDTDKEHDILRMQIVDISVWICKRRNLRFESHLVGTVGDQFIRNKATLRLRFYRDYELER